jgi:hypothetical protein
MSSVISEKHCLHCNISENQNPLLNLHYNGKELWICSQCLPTLIHAPQKLVGKLENAEQILPAKHKH